MTWNKALICSGLIALVPWASVHAAASVPKATCRSGRADRPESGLQGMTTQAEQDSGANKQGFTCNTDLVGQFQGEGGSWQFTAWKTCGYFDTSNNAAQQHLGTLVVDASDPSHPVVTEYLTTASMLDPWESLKVHGGRQLLAGGQRGGPGFSIYDISRDCRHPVLLADVNLPGSFGHTGEFAPDGKTYYITPLRSSPSLVAVDVSDPSNPRELLLWTAPSPLNPIFHDLEISDDGNTGYFTQFGGATAQNGLLILDTSDIQARRSNPQIRVIGQLSWDDGSIGAQQPLRVKIAGKPYIIFTDEGGLHASGCAAGKSPNGFARIIDISDPANPRVVSKLMLEMNDPANCSQTASGPADTATGVSVFGYSSHYCNVDDRNNATTAACSYFSAGLRIFDIHDVNNPKEIGYYKPPARGTDVLPGSQYYRFAGANFNRPMDWTTSRPSFPKDRGMSSGDIWFSSQDNGFQIVKLHTNSGGCSATGGSLAPFFALALIPMLFHRRRGRVRRC